MSTLLKGKKEIVQFSEYSWETIMELKRTRRFPVSKIRNRWVSDRVLIVRWTRDQILAGKNPCQDV